VTNTTTEPTPARSGATPEPGEKRVRFPRTRAYIQRHEFLASVTKVISGTGLAQLIAALATLYVTPHIAPADWGIYGAIMAVSQFVIPAAALRYDMAIVLPRDDSEAKRVFRLATRIHAIVSGVAMAAMVPAHMVHGSKVTTRVQSPRRQPSRASAARRIASTSARAVGSPVRARSLPASERTSPSAARITAPMGTSPHVATRRATSSAWVMA